MKRRNITVRTHEGTTEVAGYISEAFPGIAVHRSVGISDMWTATHIDIESEKGSSFSFPLRRYASCFSALANASRTTLIVGRSTLAGCLSLYLRMPLGFDSCHAHYCGRQPAGTNDSLRLLGLRKSCDLCRCRAGRDTPPQPSWSARSERDFLIPLKKDSRPLVVSPCCVKCGKEDSNLHGVNPTRPSS
jgi:hypothetical protein